MALALTVLISCQSVVFGMYVDSSYEIAANSYGIPNNLPQGYVMPQQPSPAPGVPPPSALPYPYSASAGKKFDKLTGMPLDLLEFLDNNWASSKQRITKAANDTTGLYGAVIHMKIMSEYFCNWHPEAAQAMGLSNGEAPSPEVIFGDGVLNILVTEIGTMSDKLMRWLFALDGESFFKNLDTLNHFHDSLNVRNVTSPPIVPAPFLYHTESNIAALKYFYGNEWTDEQETGYLTLWRYIFWNALNIFLMYQDGCLMRPSTALNATRACDTCGGLL